MSYFHETIWKGVPKFLRRVDTALKNIGINERVPYNAPLIQFSSWMGGDRDGTYFSTCCSCWIYVLPDLLIFHSSVCHASFLCTGGGDHCCNKC